MSDQNVGHTRSYLFTVRLWSEDTGNASTEMRGEVRHVLGGGVRYFQEWTTLVGYLSEKWQELEKQQKVEEGVTYPVEL